MAYFFLEYYVATTSEGWDRTTTVLEPHSHRCVKHALVEAKTLQHAISWVEEQTALLSDNHSTSSADKFTDLTMRVHYEEWQ